MAKKIIKVIKLQIPAGQANPAPPVGPALGQHGVNIMEFCKAFNAATQGPNAGRITPVEISVFEDRSFTFITQWPFFKVHSPSVTSSTTYRTPSPHHIGPPPERVAPHPRLRVQRGPSSVLEECRARATCHSQRSPVRRVPVGPAAFYGVGIDASDATRIWLIDVAALFGVRLEARLVVYAAAVPIWEASASAVAVSASAASVSASAASASAASASAASASASA